MTDFKFNHKQGILAPIKMIDTELNGEIRSCLAKYAHNFQGIVKLKNHQIKLHVNSNIKAVAAPPCFIPYHLKDQAHKVIQEIIINGIIEKHPKNDPAS